MSNFFEWQKAVALSAKVYKGRLETGLNTCHFRLVYTGFGLESGAILDIQIVESLAIDERNANFFALGGVY